MKFLILALFVAVASAAPLEDDSGPVELIVNGVPEGQPIDLGNIVDIKVKEHQNGEVVAATNLLHPYTAEGIAEAAAVAAVNPEPVFVAEASESEFIVPEPVVLPSPVAPEVVFPEAVVLPSPVAPEVVMPAPEPVVLPSPVAPEVVPEPVVLPSPVAPEVVMPAPEAVEAVPASLPNGEIFNDGTVSVAVNTPQEAGVLSSIQSWFSLVLNYFNDGAQTTQQIV